MHSPRRFRNVRAFLRWRPTTWLGWVGWALVVCATVALVTFLLWPSHTWGATDVLIMGGVLVGSAIGMRSRPR